MAKLTKDSIIETWHKFPILEEMCEWYDVNVIRQGLTKDNKSASNFWGDAKYPSQHKDVCNHFMRTYIDKLKSDEIYVICAVVEYLIQEKESKAPSHIPKQNEKFMMNANFGKYQKNTPSNKTDKWFAVANLIDCRTKWRY